MKVIKNACYGGFSVSDEAIKLYIKKKYNCDNPYCYAFVGDELVQITEDSKEIFKYYSHKRNATEDEAYGTFSFTHSKKDRTDPILVKVVEELGDKANGRYANLKIVNIPNNIDWEIDEYDGWETISEKHRTW